MLERILANAPAIRGSAPVHVHVVDPFPPGGGKVWRREQSPLMWMNAMAADVTMFPDDTVTCDGPIRTGPSLAEWASTVDDDECEGMTGTSFASRRLQGRYLQFVFERVVAQRPPSVTVTVHATQAVRLTEDGDGRQVVWLKDRAEPVRADAVVLTIGHQDSAPDAEEKRFLDFAGRHDLRYMPRAFSVDVDLSAFRPGESVLMRGFGLACVDLTVLLTEGRGGRYITRDGTLAYLPSGREPVLHIGSRRGVPYRAKFTYKLDRDLAALPRFFDATAILARFPPPRTIDFRADLWPLMAKEVGWGYYHELCVGHPDRTTVKWDEFAADYSGRSWYSGQMDRLVRAGVPARTDQLDFEAMDRPLAGRRFADLGELHAYMCEYISGDITRRSDPAYSADLAAFFSLLTVNAQVARILHSGRMAARSAVRDVRGWWQGFFDYVGSGPPGVRSQQLLALADAGVVRFLGAEMSVDTDEARGVFVGGSASVPDTVDATALIEARLPSAELRSSPDPLVRQLYESGEVSEYVVSDPYGYTHRSGLLHVSPVDFQLFDGSGNPHPRRYALGPHTNITQFATFARPRSNAMSFRQNDELARSVLRVPVAGIPPRREPT